MRDGAEWAGGGAAARPRPAPPRAHRGHREALRPRAWRRGGADRGPEGPGGDRRGQGCGESGDGAGERPLEDRTPPRPRTAAPSGRLPTSLPAARPPPISPRPAASPPGPGAPRTPHSLAPWRSSPGRPQGPPARRPLPMSPLLRASGLGSSSSCRDTQLCDPLITTGVPLWGPRPSGVKGRPGRGKGSQDSGSLRHSGWGARA